MTGFIIYRERLFSGLIFFLTLLPALFFLAILIYQILVGPVGEKPAPNWVYFLLFIFFLLTSFNFSYINILLTPTELVVSYGVFKKRILLRDVVDCYKDDLPQFGYGGWGIRIKRIHGTFRLVYNTIGTDRVVVVLRRGTFKEFAFSTKNPEKVGELIRQYSGLGSPQA